MTCEHLNTKPTRAVKVGFLDGGERFGRIRSFSAQDEDLIFEEDGDGNDIRTPQLIPACSVAYVAWLYQDAPARPRDRGPGVPIHVHLAQGRTVLVEPLTDLQNSLGFRAVPIDDGGDIEEIFFYAHATHRIERDEPLGSMLLEADALCGTELEHGLDRQAGFPRKRIGEILLAQNRIDPDDLSWALAAQSRKGVRIGEVLIAAGLATRENIETALAEQRQSGRQRIGEILVEMGVVDELVLAKTLAKKFHLPFVDLDTCMINPKAARSIPRWILEKHDVLPIDIEENQITLVLSDPLNTEVIDLVRFQFRKKILEVVATPSQVKRYLKDFLSKDDSRPEETRLQRLPNGPDVDLIEPIHEEDDLDSFEIRESDGTVIQLANQIIVEAVQREASDIHIEPRRGGEAVGVRIRVDGECVALPVVPVGYGRPLVSRIKIMAKLDISEQRKPQDGKLRIRIGDRRVELRVATIPTVSGEDIVLRILPDSGPIALDQMGLNARNLLSLERLARHTSGLLLCVGPTGSGKTTSLHSLLGHINVPERKIWTAEDPVEITQAGLRQVEMRPNIGFGFAEALRAFLRADPDVIMVGEMRDPETAEIGVHASLTGHLVLSTLHTNSAPEATVRLAQMGLDPFSFSDALLGILAQRLARRLCEACRSLEPANESDRAALQSELDRNSSSEKVGKLLWQARGCDACRGSGYRGRVALHELLVVDDPLRAAIQGGANVDRIREIAIEGGMTTMFHDGVQKCLMGMTDLRQVRAVCGNGDSPEDVAPAVVGPNF